MALRQSASLTGLHQWSGGKEGMLSRGTYPEAPLKLARVWRDEARSGLAAGTDPSEQRKADKAAHAVMAKLYAWPLPGFPALAPLSMLRANGTPAWRRAGQPGTQARCWRC